MFARETRTFVGIHGATGTARIKITTSRREMRKVRRAFTDSLTVEMKARRTR